MNFWALGGFLHFLEICHLISETVVMVHLSGSNISDLIFLSFLFKDFFLPELQILSLSLFPCLPSPLLSVSYIYNTISGKFLTGLFYNPLLLKPKGKLGFLNSRQALFAASRKIPPCPSRPGISPVIAFHCSSLLSAKD